MTIMTLAPARAAHDGDTQHRAAVSVPGHRSPRLRAHKPEKIEGGPRFPLNSLQAEDLMDRDGYVEVTLLLDQEKYFSHVIASSVGGVTPENYAHEVAFSFGRTDESVARIIGVSGSAFIVTYRTHVREFLDD